MVDLKEPKMMLRDLSGEKLDEVHGRGYYDYLDDPEYVDNVLGCAARMIVEHAGQNAVVLDAGCGAGALGLSLPESVEYIGFDSSKVAISKANMFLRNRERWTTIVSRIEEFCDLTFLGIEFCDAVHFGNVLYCLIQPDARIPFVEKYVERFQPRFLVISELECFDSTPLKERFELLEGETFHLKIPGVSKVKNRRKVEIYATGVERNG